MRYEAIAVPTCQQSCHGEISERTTDLETLLVQPVRAVRELEQRVRRFILQGNRTLKTRQDQEKHSTAHVFQTYRAALIAVLGRPVLIQAIRQRRDDMLRREPRFCITESSSQRQ